MAGGPGVVEKTMNPGEPSSLVGAAVCLRAYLRWRPGYTASSSRPLSLSFSNPSSGEHGLSQLMFGALPGMTGIAVKRGPVVPCTSTRATTVKVAPPSPISTAEPRKV